MTPPVLDALGKPCPLPVIELATAVEALPPGEEILLLSDDPGAKVDVPVWCRMTGHEHLATTDAERGWAFRVRRTHGPASDTPGSHPGWEGRHR